MTESEMLSKMVPPGQKRPGVWRSGVLQIQITRACTQSCFGCTQASNLAGKPAMMTPDQFETACKSLEGYFGLVGVFGGCPTVSPYFEEICEILSSYFPFEQRGLWANDPMGKGAICRKTFNPEFSNINVHLDKESHAEFCRDWPEIKPYIIGLKEDSRHGPPFVAMQDMGLSEDEIRERVSKCEVNQRWSALIGMVRGNLRAYVCELMYTQAVLHENDPDWIDVGIDPIPGWWKSPMEDFADQVKFHCRMCGMPLKAAGDLAIGGTREQVSKSHAQWFRPKTVGRPVELVESLEQLNADFLPVATNYLQNSSLPILY